MMLTCTEWSTDLPEITGYIENPQVSQGTDIVYFPNWYTPFFREAESDLKQLFSMYKNDIVESRMKGNEMKLIQRNILRDCYF